MVRSEYLAHECTLLGAIDSYLSEVVHTRPYLASAQREALEHFAEWWLNEQGGANDMAAAGEASLSEYLTRIEHGGTAMAPLRSFFDWARREGLTSVRAGA
jgi:hypothetical protein